MKIANRTNHVAIFTLTAALFLTGHNPAHAQTAAPPVASPPPANVADTLNRAVTPAASDDSKSLSAAEDKATASVKSEIRRLSSTDNMTLDDLNEARQVSAKIEALIEIEKRMAELEKLRSDREGRVEGMPSFVPASALSMPIQKVAPMPSSVVAAPPAQMPFNNSSNINVSRIVGTAGQYSAVVDGPEGEKTVKVGDHIGDNTVVAINSAGIQVERNKIRRIIQVKNVETVFGSASP